MANEVRLIDANALIHEIIFVKKCLASEDKAGEWAKGYRSGLVSALAQIDETPTVDAVILPKGKPGDYVLWTNGGCQMLFEIYSIMICKDGIRYDLGDYSPFVNHSHILKIMNREEAERWMENGK